MTSQLSFNSGNTTVDGRNPANQLRLVVYPIIYMVLCFIHPINSMKQILHPTNKKPTRSPLDSLFSPMFWKSCAFLALSRFGWGWMLERFRYWKACYSWDFFPNSGQISSRHWHDQFPPKGRGLGREIPENFRKIQVGEKTWPANSKDDLDPKIAQNFRKKNGCRLGRQGTAMIMDEEASLLKRSWCLFELLQTVRWGRIQCRYSGQGGNVRKCLKDLKHCCMWDVFNIDALYEACDVYRSFLDHTYT